MTSDELRIEVLRLVQGMRACDVDTGSDVAYESLCVIDLRVREMMDRCWEAMLSRCGSRAGGGGRVAVGIKEMLDDCSRVN